MAAIRLTCPHCSVVLRVAAELAPGAKVRCPGCEELFKPGGSAPANNPSAIASRKNSPQPGKAAPVPEPDDPDEEPAPRSRKTSRGPSGRAKRSRGREEDDEDEETTGSSKGLLIGGVIGAAVLLAVGITVLIAVNRDGKEPEPAPFVQNKPLPGDGPGPGPIGKPSPDPAKDQKIDNTPPPPLESGLPAAVLSRVKKATVYIRVQSRQGGRSTGTGFFGMSGGLVLTNAHVVGMLEEGAVPPARIEVILNSGLPGERIVGATVVSADRSSDLAVLRAMPAAGAAWPDPLVIASAAELRETQKVFVFGYPFGEQLGKNITISESSVSSLRRDSFGNLVKVQVNGGMNPGNSGGPVTDSQGNVIGVAVAGIKGTQLNFAVPGEHVQTLTRGRISGTSMGQPLVRGGKIILPMTVSMLDPLGSIGAVSIDWWIGEPGGSRGPSAFRPALLPGDGPRTTTQCTYDPASGKAEVELPLEAMPAAGKVLWFQPAMTDAQGKELWVAALPQKLNPPLEAETVRMPLPLQVSRAPMDIQSMAKFSLKGNEARHSLMKNIVGRFWEDTRSIARDGTVISCLSVSNRFEVGFTLDGEAPPASPRLKQIIQDVGKISLLVVSDRGFTAREKLTDTRRVPPGSRPVLTALAKQLHESLDLAILPLPAGEVKPGTSWQADKMLAIDLIDDDAVLGRVPMTYSYVGVRSSAGNKVAVIEMRGELSGFEDRGASLRGSARGEALYDLNAKRITEVHVRTEVTLKLQFGGEEVVAQGTLNTDILRGKPIPLPANLPPLTGFGR